MHSERNRGIRRTESCRANENTEIPWGYLWADSGLSGKSGWGDISKHAVIPFVAP